MPDPAAGLDELLSVAVDAAQTGGDVALGWARQPDSWRAREKAGPGDLVSDADVDVEQAIRAIISERRRQDTIVGEEGGVAPGDSGIVWAIDPIDGTTEFLYGRCGWAVSVAALRAADGAVLAGAVSQPVLGELLAARSGGGTVLNGERVMCRRPTDSQRALVEVNLGHGTQRDRAGAVVDRLVREVRDVRDCGSAACALASVATGRLDAYWGPGLRVWDAAAGLLLVVEAGGEVGDLRGDSFGCWPSSGNVLAAASGRLAQHLREMLSEVGAAADGGAPQATLA